MKRILLLLLLPAFLQAQIKVKDLPTTTTGSTGDFLLKDDAAGIPGSTKKISVANFKTTYFGSYPTGSGTLNYLPKWTPSGTVLGNSQISDNGTSLTYGSIAGSSVHAFRGAGFTVATDNFFEKPFISADISGLALGYNGTAVQPSASFIAFSSAQMDIQAALMNMTGNIKYISGTPGVGKIITDNGAGTGIFQWNTLASAGVVGGTGTQNYVTKWNNAGGTTIGNSQIFDDGTNVGIGTNVPLQKLHLVGNTYLNGNVGIGTSSPQASLHVGDGNGLFRYNTNASVGTPYVSSPYLYFTGKFWSSFFGSSQDLPAYIYYNSSSVYRGLNIVNPGGPDYVTTFDENGNVGIGTTNPNAKLTIKNGVAKYAGNYHSIFDNFTLIDKKYADSIATVAASTKISGSLTSGYVPRASGSTTLVNGQITDDGTDIGINAADNVNIYGVGDVFMHSDASVQIGTTQGNAINIGKPSLASTVQIRGSLQYLDAGSTYGLGKIMTSGATGIGTWSDNLSLTKETTHTFEIAASTTTDANGGSWVWNAGDANGNGNGGTIDIGAGISPGSGTAGDFRIGKFKSPLNTEIYSSFFKFSDPGASPNAIGDVWTATDTDGHGYWATPSSGSGTVTSVTSANGNATVANTTTTPVITIVSAPKLETARTINGTSFDGTGNITVTAAAGTLTGSTLASGVTASSLTSFGSNIALGTPGSGTLTNCTGLPIGSGISGLGTGVATFLGTPSSANLLAALTDETGTGASVFGTSPTFTTNITAPIVIGGTGTGSSAEIRSTSGVGATDFIKFTVGNNGATEAGRINTTGQLLYGTTSATSANDIANFSKAQNAATSIRIINSNGGTGAFSQIVTNNGTNELNIGINGTGVTGGGLFGTASRAWIGTSNSAGVGMYASNASGNLYFYTGGSADANLAMSITSARKITVTTGVTADGGGLKHARVTTGSVTAGATALVTITWGTAFADANYTVTADVVEATTSASSMSVVHIESVSASAVTVRVVNNSAGSLTGTINAIAIHD